MVLILGQSQLLLGSLVVGIIAIAMLGMLLLYWLCSRQATTSEQFGGNISSILTELMAAKTFSETGNERLAVNMLKHSTNWQNQAREPVHHDMIPPIPEPTPKEEDQHIGPVVSDEEVIGEDDAMTIGGPIPPEEGK